jgi:uncharacterized delta-60 repeat protein
MRRFDRRPTLFRLLSAAILFAGAATPALAQDGAYVVEPWFGSYEDVIIQPGDQKIVAVGDLKPGNDPTGQRVAIARYDPLGNPDTTYGIGGPSIPPLGGVSAPALGPSPAAGYELVLQADGKAVVSGYAQANSSLAVVRFNIDGTLDGNFGVGGWTTLDASGTDFFNFAEGVGLQTSGKVVVAATSVGQGTNPTLAEVARFTAAGVIDSGNGGFGQVVRGKPVGYTFSSFGLASNVFNDLAVQPDDRLVAVGTGYNDATSHRLIVARYTASGTLDKTFNGNGSVVFLPAGSGEAFGSAAALQPNGKIVVAGTCSGIDGAHDMLVARFNTNGTLDTSFGGGNGYVRLDIDSTASVTAEDGRAVVIQSDGKIVAAGDVSVSGGPRQVLVVRLNPDGTPDPTFGAGGFKVGAPLPNTGYHSFWGTGVALRSDNGIVVAGYDDQDPTGHNFSPHPLLMRFNP